MKITQTRIDLTNLLFRAGHGEEEREKVAGNTYCVSLSVWPTEHSAMMSDCVGETISYADLYDLVRRVMTEERPSDLLEHVVYRILQELEAAPLSINRASVSITKVQPPIKGFRGDGATFSAEATF